MDTTFAEAARAVTIKQEQRHLSHAAGRAGLSAAGASGFFQVADHAKARHMVATRRSLPPTRRSHTHKFQIMGYEGYLTLGLFEDGSPGEIFVKMAKEGSTLSGMVQGFCRAFSLALQYGLSLEDAVMRFKGMRFEPMGHTSNPEIPHATSIIDYVARYIEVNFCETCMAARQRAGAAERLQA